jgi:hypothetical protein
MSTPAIVFAVRHHPERPRRPTSEGSPSDRTHVSCALVERRNRRRRLLAGSSRTVCAMFPFDPARWSLPGDLDVLPADEPGGLVARVSTLTCVEVGPPDRASLLGEELSETWHRIRDHHRDRLSSSIASFNGEIPLAVDLDPLGGALRWYRSDYASHVASLEVVKSTGTPRPGLDLAPSMLVLIACTEGWVRSRRSGKVSLPHHWQHAAAETLTLEDLGGVLDLRRPALRALSEEFALDAGIGRMHPWLVQCQGEPGRGARFVFYVVADLRELSLGDIRSSQRRATDAWEIDEVSAACLPGDWEGLRTLPRLLLPCRDPDAWFADPLDPLLR